MINITSVIDGMFSVTDFNKGKANQIFYTVKTNKIGVVVKNNRPECILLDPEEYKRIMKKIEDSEDYALAMQRLQNSDLSRALSSQEVFGDISENELEEIGEIDFE